jgi:tetratricopeptide (TPR) repeat protein
MKKRAAIAGVFFTLAIFAPAFCKAQSQIDSARTFFQQGRYSDARNVLRGEILKSPNNADLFYWLGKSDFELYDNDGAISNAERAVQLAYSNSEFHYFLGTTYGYKSQYANPFTALSLARKTEHEFAKAVELDPHNMHAQRDLISYCIQAPSFAGGGEEKAQEHITKLMALDPVQGHLAQLELYSDKKKWGEATQEADAVMAAKPKDASPYLELIEYYKDRSEAAKMRGVLAEVPASAKADPHVNFYRAVADVIANDHLDEAKSLIAAYLAKTPAPQREDHAPLAEAHVWLGRIAEQEGRRQDAITEYKIAIKLDSHDKLAHEALRKLGA